MFDNMSVKTKLFGLTALLLALMVAMGVMGLARMAQVQEHLRTVYEDRTVPLVQLATVVEAQNSIRYDVAEAAASEDPARRNEALAPIPGLAETINKTWKEYRSTFLTPEEKQLGDEWETLRKAFIGERDKVMNLIRAEQIAEARAAIPAFTEAYTRSRAVMEKLTALQADVAKQEYEQAVQEYERARLVSTGVIVVAAVLGLFVAWQVVASIVKPLQRAVATAGLVAGGDLSQPVDTSRAGAELGQLLQAMASMQQALREMVGQIQRDADSLAGTARELAQSSEEVARASGIQSEASSSIAAAVEEMTVSISHIASRTDDTRNVSSQAGELAQNGEAVTARTGDSVRQIATSVTSTSNQIEALSQKINQISAVVNVIKDIADQTNLLALNAAIEAARAGEQGRGFAVVADEVRKLAERTTQSTGEISSVIGQILDAAASSVTQMRESVVQVNAGVALSEEAGATIARINAIEAQVVDAVNEIATALKEQSAASTDIAQQVERIAQAAEENNAAVGATAESSQTVSRLGASLQQAVARFRV